MTKLFKNQESGRSMIEMLGVLAIMGIITVGAVTMISTAMRGQKRTTVQDEVTQIVLGVRTLLGEYNDYSNIDNDTIFAAMKMTPKNPYNGDYVVSADQSDSRQFIVTITGLNKSDCEYFKTKAWSDSVGYSLSDGKVSGADADPSDCSGDNGQNKISIVYGD